MSAIKYFKNELGIFRWGSVKPTKLEMDGIEGVTKNILIGLDDHAPHSIMRFFWLEPGGHSMLERHPQEHEVIVLTGKGTVRIGEEISEIKAYDVVFVSPNELHQFNNPHDEPFGFICVIPILEQG